MKKKKKKEKKEQIMKLKSLCGLSRSSALFSLDFPPTIPHFFFLSAQVLNFFFLTTILDPPENDAFLFY